MMKKTTILLISCVVSAMLAITANANTLSGVITDAEGNPLNGVLVRVTEAQSIVAESVYTNTKANISS